VPKDDSAIERLRGLRDHARRPLDLLKRREERDLEMAEKLSKRLGRLATAKGARARTQRSLADWGEMVVEDRAESRPKPAPRKPAGRAGKLDAAE
jgi:hypothetical protein